MLGKRLKRAKKRSNKNPIAEGLKRAYKLLGTLNKALVTMRSPKGIASGMQYHIDEAREHLKKAYALVDRL